MEIGLDTVAMKSELYGIGNYINSLVISLLSGLSEDRYLLITSQSGKRHFERLGESVSLETCPANRFLRIYWEQVQLPGILKSRRLQLFHGLASVAPLLITCPSVLTVHDLTTLLTPDHHTVARRSYLRWMIPRACRRADAIIAVSESTRDDLVEQLEIPGEKISVVYLGVSKTFRPIKDPEELLRVRRKYNLPEKFILYVGLIEPRKNLDTLIAAYEAAEDVHREVSLVLAGSLGWRYQPLLSRIRSSKVARRIFMPGYIKSEDLAAVYGASSLFVYPSLYEGFGLPILEAMACGTPVITSNISSMPEVAGEAALLIDPHSPSDLASAMRRVLAEPAVSSSLSERGKLRAQSFTWDETARKTRQVYEQLVG
jgi:glycosyltransferase involved in cell wall biosynthesis